MKIVTSTDVKAVDRLLAAAMNDDRRVLKTVSAIVSSVKKRGDAALLRHARRVDRITGSLEVAGVEID